MCRLILDLHCPARYSGPESILVSLEPGRVAPSVPDLTADLEIVGSIPACGKFPFRPIFASHQ